jgi:T-complex protein 1 subunit gamma
VCLCVLCVPRYFVYLVECREPKACTIVLRGASKDVLNEVERNLQDAMCVARNIVYDRRLVYGGGAIETAVSHALLEKAKSIEGIQQKPYRAIAESLEVIPRTLIQNSGANPIRVLTELRVSPCYTLVAESIGVACVSRRRSSGKTCFRRTSVGC